MNMWSLISVIMVTGVQHGTIFGSQPYGLPLGEVTTPQYLKALGYRTHGVGKVKYRTNQRRGSMRKDGAMFRKLAFLTRIFLLVFRSLPFPVPTFPPSPPSPRPHLPPIPTFPPSPPSPFPSDKSTRGIKSEGEEMVLKEPFVQHRNFASCLYHLWPGFKIKLCVFCLCCFV